MIFLKYIKTMLMLLIDPRGGWGTVSSWRISFDHLLRRGYLPLTGITALSEFVPLAYMSDLTFWSAFGRALAVAGSMFASIFAARLFLDIVLLKYISGNINPVKINNLALYLVGFDCLYRIFANLLPAPLTFLSFLPLLSILMLFKSTAYVGVSEDRVINYLFLSFVGVVVIPALFCRLVLMLI